MNFFISMYETKIIFTFSTFFLPFNFFFLLVKLNFLIDLLVIFRNYFLLLAFSPFILTLKTEFLLVEVRIFLIKN